MPSSDITCGCPREVLGPSSLQFQPDRLALGRGCQPSPNGLGNLQILDSAYKGCESDLGNIITLASFQPARSGNRVHHRAVPIDENGPRLGITPLAPFNRVSIIDPHSQSVYATRRWGNER